MKSKFIFLFLLFFLIGTLAAVIFGIVRENPGKPVNNIIQTITKPGFSIENAPSETIRGNIIQMSGGVQWESRVATQASEIKSPVTLQQGESMQTEVDGNLNIEFPNEAKIKVNPASEIDFVQTLPVNFVVNIASGSAEFTKLSTIPVTIRALHLLTKINSGQTNIKLDTDNSLVNLEVVSGSVTVAYNDTDLVSHEMDFQRGDKIVFNDLTRQLDF